MSKRNAMTLLSHESVVVITTGIIGSIDFV